LAINKVDVESGNAVFIVTAVWQVNATLDKYARYGTMSEESALLPPFAIGIAHVRFNMHVYLLKSKIHRAAVTSSSLNYEGSMTIDADLMEKVGFIPYEKILCSNLANGNRFETYVIAGERGSGAIVLNGATAHLGKVGDLITIMGYAAMEPEEALRWHPKVIILGPGNQIINERGI
jgi:aspartate 1-decarboxylase